MKFLKLGSAFVLTLALAANIVVTSSAAARDNPDIKVVAYGRVMKLSEQSIKRSNSIYIPLREMCETMGASVRWDSNNMLAVIHYKQKSYIPDIVIVKNKAFAKANALEGIFGCNVETFDKINVVTINQKDKQTSLNELLKILPSFGGYTKDDIEWLAKIVHAEARGEDYNSKLAVANVILNRVNSPMFPDTIKEVIFDKKSGVQFTPTVNGSINNTPSTDSYFAALEALEGNNNAHNTLFFINPKIAKSTWVSNNREFAFALGNHNFYN